MTKPATKAPTVIYLEPAQCADPITGSLWCEDNIGSDDPETGEPIPWTMYVRAGADVQAHLDAERARAEKAERERDAAIAELGAEGRRRGQAVAAAEADAAAARKAARHYRDALYRIAGGSSYADDPWDIARFALKFGEKQQ